MCGDHNDSCQHSSSSSSSGSAMRGKYLPRDDMESVPDWESMPMPSSHILSHLTDAHCHSTDLTHESRVYDAVQLGGLASMATIVDDQDKVKALSGERAWYPPSTPGKGPEKDGFAGQTSVLGKRGKGGKGVGVVACFGYHPWFTHLYTLSPADGLPTKEKHYASLFLSSSTSSTNTKNKQLLESLLPYLPDPIAFAPLIDKLRTDIRESLDAGRLTVLGEVGLDGSARLRWPIGARCLHPESKCASVSEARAEQAGLGEDDVGDEGESKEETSSQKTSCNTTCTPGASEETAKEGSEAITSSPKNDNASARKEEEGKEDEDEDEEQEQEEDWKRLTPFKVPMSHQRAILDAQLEVAIELGVNVSFHSVAAAGPSFDTLKKLRDKHGGRFTNRINVDLHSAGGWSPEFWKQAERNLQNLYASPSIFITSRSPSASALIREISSRRILVESDSHDVRLSSRLVWAATEWVSRVKGWRLEGRDAHGHARSGVDGKEDREGNEGEEWAFEVKDEDEQVDKRGRILPKDPNEIWTVQTLERNWARFMRLTDD